MAAVIDSEVRRQANLRSLQRIDPKIQDLGTTVSHVVLYEWSTPKKTWEKKDMEGSLFVAKRRDSPMFKLILLNRNSNENLEVAIRGTFQMTKRDQIVIFRDSASTEEAIRGIWFHDAEERDNFLRYVENVVKAIGQIEEMEQSKAVETKPEKDVVNAGTALLATLNLGSKSDNTQTQVEANAQKIESAAGGDTNTNNNSILLDKKSLQLSLLSLIQDERFLDLIHAQYIKVSNARNAREQQASKGSEK